MTERPSYPAARLDYSLPPELIAQQPLPERSASRMLHVRSGSTVELVGQASSLPASFHRQDACATGEHGQNVRPTTSFSDRLFSELPELLPPGCLIVLNNSRVIPARLVATRAVRVDGRGGGRVEILYHRWLGDGVCEAVVGSNARLPAGEVLVLPEGWSCELLEPKALDGIRVRFIAADGQSAELSELLGYLNAQGETPLPPYIKRPAGWIGGAGILPVSSERQAGSLPHLSADRARYQTVYAAQDGAVAAPTAGLHFDEAMLARLRADGHEIVNVTLHVGLGTFAPLRVDDLRDHVMHEEAYSVEPQAFEAYMQARAAGRPVLAVGTTSLRVLHTVSVGARFFSPSQQQGDTGSGGVPPHEAGRRDTAATGNQGGTSLAPTNGSDKGDNNVAPTTGLTRAFIYPGHETDACDMLLTNFHLPRSTLLALVYSFGGEELLRAAYAHAIAQRYRFFSYGDCMLIDRRSCGRPVQCRR